MTADELISMLNRGCTGGLTAIRSITRLQPTGGVGDKIFPPTYAEGVYAFEKRMIDGNTVDTVLLDSVQSQANRFEDVLLDAFRSGRLAMPVFEMSVAGHDVTSLTVPHRVHDAILRDSIWDGKLFRESDNGKRLASARAWDATAFFEFAPTVLLFGTWDSQSGGGVNTAKVARSLVSEIIAIGFIRGVRTSSRIDPLGIKLVPEVMAKADGPELWRFVEPGADGKKAKKDEGKLKPSKLVHGNIMPSITDRESGPGGITCREAVQTTVLSLTQLRKLRFPTADGARSADRDIAGRAVIAALGILAVTLQQEDGYQLRSRCQLVPSDAPKFKLIGRTEKEHPDTFDVDSAAAAGALQAALVAAGKVGLKWNSESIRLQPRPDLVKLVEYSDRTTGGGAEGE